MHLAELHLSNFRLFKTLRLQLRPGLNVLVGENDSGKTAVVDAIRLALGAASQDGLRIEQEDFHTQSGNQEPEAQLTITCKFEEISQEEAGGFYEHLSYDDGKPILYVTLAATRREGTNTGRRRMDVTLRSGRDGTGPWIDGPIREFLQTTYLKPLRDAVRELSAGRNSRLSQVLQFTQEIRSHSNESFDPAGFVESISQKKPAKLPNSLPNIGKLADHLISQHHGISSVRTRLDDDYLAPLALYPDKLASRVGVSAQGADEVRLRHILEKLELTLRPKDGGEARLQRGLGYNNVLFMACELLLLGQDGESLPLLLVEEPEAHLHPQLQLRLVDFLSQRAKAAAPKEESQESQRPLQVILTTHSPHLASKLPLESLILLAHGQAFPLSPGNTKLALQDYTFLERFLDATKANLFFARGVIIVEGDAENLLLPTIAQLIGHDLAEHGVSIVNVGGVGLSRYAQIFQTSDAKSQLPIPVACLTDSDIMPNCAPAILRLEDKPTGTTGTRRWRKESDFATKPQERIKWLEKRKRAEGGNVRTFLAERWTLEYELAISGLERELFYAIELADNEDVINNSAEDRKNVIKQAIGAYAQLQKEEPDPQRRATLICKRLRNNVSKAATAQHLAHILKKSYSKENGAAELERNLPNYLTRAIKYVTRGYDATAKATTTKPVTTPGAA